MKKHASHLGSLLLTFAASLHIVRVLAGWDLIIGSWVVPVWLSVVVFLLAASAAWHSWKS